MDSVSSTINIWISSVCQSPEGMTYLMNAIVSCLVLEQPLKVVVSIFTDQNLDPIRRLFESGNKEYQICVRDRPYTQFEHIEALTQEQSLTDDDWVIFLDDDDMLLNSALKYLSKDINGYVGYQFIPEYQGSILPGSTDLSITNLYPFIQNNYRKMIQADDFSGTAIRFKYLKQFFVERKKETLPANSVRKWALDVIESLSDTQLMKYIEKVVPNTLKLYMDPTVNPFVYHRLKPTPSIWRQQLGI